ncbi:MAG: hypothetical protein NTV95_00460 [Candidatus Saccharibacteria bacterium]|nr:hypothetical protein [Candidatus Saccharibacteria bacterium]
MVKKSKTTTPKVVPKKPESSRLTDTPRILEYLRNKSIIHSDYIKKLNRHSQK